MAVSELTFREGSVSDLETTFGLSARAMHDSAVKQGVMPSSHALTDAHIRGDWARQRSMIEFIASQPGGRYLIACDGDVPVGYARTVRFDGMEELTELMVLPFAVRQGFRKSTAVRTCGGSHGLWRRERTPAGSSPARRRPRARPPNSFCA